MGAAGPWVNLTAMHCSGQPRLAMTGSAFRQSQCAPYLEERAIRRHLVDLDDGGLIDPCRDALNSRQARVAHFPSLRQARDQRLPRLRVVNERRADVEHGVGMGGEEAERAARHGPFDDVRSSGDISTSAGGFAYALVVHRSNCRRVRHAEVAAGQCCPERHDQDPSNRHRGMCLSRQGQRLTATPEPRSPCFQRSAGAARRSFAGSCEQSALESRTAAVELSMESKWSGRSHRRQLWNQSKRPSHLPETLFPSDQGSACALGFSRLLLLFHSTAHVIIYGD